jgi:RNA polymerase sigma-54 factor
MRKKTLDKSTKEYITNNFNRARWFIDAINSRRETMLKIMEAIIERQNYFFENNGERLSPLYEKDVAENIKMDTSTVSRAVRGKFVQTDFGIYELRSFFTSPLATNDGEDVSNVEAKVRLKEFIDNENKMKPLTDEELTNEMNKKGFKIARRTIAKYREAINIPVAKLRREI